MQTDVALPRINGHPNHTQAGVRSESEVRRLAREAVDQGERQCEEKDVAHEAQDEPMEKALAFGGGGGHWGA